MKRFMIVLIAGVMLLGLTACGGAKEETYKVGFGSVTSLSVQKDKTTGKETGVQGNTTFAVVVLDSKDKIVKVQIDTDQNTAKINEDGTVATSEVKASKKVLGKDYNMAGSSSIKKEWFEQVAALENKAVGLTVAEFVGLKADDIKTEVTIGIDAYTAAVEVASKNTVEVKGLAKIGIGSSTSFGAKSVQINATIAAVGLDKDGKIVYSSLDVAQNSAKFADGTFGTPSVAKTKKEKGADYGMKTASAEAGRIKGGAEWFEQAAELEKESIGKTVEEFLAIPTEKRDDSHLHVPSGDDLKTRVTITIEGYQAAIKVAGDQAADIK